METGTHSTAENRDLGDGSVEHLQNSLEQVEHIVHCLHNLRVRRATRRGWLKGIAFVYSNINYSMK